MDVFSAGFKHKAGVKVATEKFNVGVGVVVQGVGICIFDVLKDEGILRICQCRYWPISCNISY